jgi:glycosyltransferase involved in cell wall biosynthesis
VNKVIHIITRLDMGGSAQNTLLTCLGLNERYDLILVHGLSRESKMTDWEKQSAHQQIENAVKRGVKVIPIPSLVRRIDPVQDLRSFFSLWRLMIQERPDIVHTHTSKAGILGRLAAKMASVPTIVHTPHGHVFYGHFGAISSRFFLLLERLFACITDCLVALTEEERKDYIKLSIIDPENVFTIHSGVKIDRFLSARVDVEEKKRTLGLNPKAPVVGTVGWLLSIKGPMNLLKAMGRVWQERPEVELVYVGKGELQEALETRAFQMGVFEKVKFLGWRDDIEEILPILDLFVLPSLNEGMGRVLVEAMAAGRPIVATKVGGIPDLVKHKETGLLVPPGNDQALAEAILQVLMDPARAREMGEKGKTGCYRFSLQTMLDGLESLYHDLLKERQRLQESSALY